MKSVMPHPHKILKFRENQLEIHAHIDVETTPPEPSMTDQQFADECDINKIVNKYLKTGDDSLLQKFRGQYADLTEIPDLQTAIETVNLANEAFESLPAKLRERFNNSPEQMIQFLHSEKPHDLEESIQLGLRNPKPPPQIDPQIEILKQINENTKKPKPKNTED